MANLLSLNGKIIGSGSPREEMIAPVELSTTASQAYAIGEQFILNGTLYTATAAITAGGTIVINGNCTASDTVTEQIKDISDELVKCIKIDVGLGNATAGTPIDVGYLSILTNGKVGEYAKLKGLAFIKAEGSTKIDYKATVTCLTNNMVRVMPTETQQRLVVTFGILY